MLHESSVRIVSPVQLWTWRAVSPSLVGSRASSSGASWVSATGGRLESSVGSGSNESVGLAAATGGGLDVLRVASRIAAVQPAVAAISAMIARACQPLTRLPGIDGP